MASIFYLIQPVSYVLCGELIDRVRELTDTVRGETFMVRAGLRDTFSTRHAWKWLNHHELPHEQVVWTDDRSRYYRIPCVIVWRFWTHRNPVLTRDEGYSLRDGRTDRQAGSRCYELTRLVLLPRHPHCHHSEPTERLLYTSHDMCWSTTSLTRSTVQATSVSYRLTLSSTCQ